MRKPMVAMMMTPRDPARRALLVAANSSNSLMKMTMRTKMTSPSRKTALAMRAKKAVRTRTTMMMMPKMPRMKMRTWTTALTRMSSKPSRRRPLLSTFLAPEGPGVVLEPLPSSLRRSSPRNDVIN